MKKLYAFREVKKLIGVTTRTIQKWNREVK